MYAVVVLLSDNVENELNELRSEFTTKLTIVSFPPHITLVYPFNASNKLSIRKSLESVTNHVKAFNIILSGVNYFESPDKVAFIDVRKIDSLLNLKDIVIQSLTENGTYIPREVLDFHPHVTIATNIPNDIFTVMKKSYSTYNKNFEVKVQKIALATNNDNANWRIESIYELKDTN